MSFRAMLVCLFVTVVSVGTLWAEVNPKAMLSRDVGVWDCEVKMYTAPNAPEVSKGTETNFMVGDHWLVSHFKGKIMGMDFEGHSHTGYDAATKKFVGTWVDSMSPYSMKTEATWDEAKQTMTTMGVGKDPAGTEAQSKMVIVYDKEGNRNFTMYGMLNGAEVKMMEIKYTKQKAKN
jgi:hypothetical protein